MNEEEMAIKAYTGKKWMVLKTRSRHEKKLRGILTDILIPHFLPTIQQKTRHRGKKRLVEKPLFSGYLFACAAPEDTITILDSKCCAQLLPVTNQKGLIQELLDIKHFLDSHTDQELVAFFSVPVGAYVTVTKGPFKGVQGRVLKQKGKDLLIVSVEMLGLSVGVELDETSVIVTSRA